MIWRLALLLVILGLLVAGIALVILGAHQIDASRGSMSHVFNYRAIARQARSAEIAAFAHVGASHEFQSAR